MDELLDGWAVDHERLMEPVDGGVGDDVLRQRCPIGLHLEGFCGGVVEVEELLDDV